MKRSIPAAPSARRRGARSGPFTLMIDATAKVALREVGHLMAAHHHYANCVEGLTNEGEYGELSPCTLMFNFVVPVDHFPV